MPGWPGYNLGRRKKTGYRNKIPVNPSKITINILLRGSLGSPPSIFMVKKTRKKEAIKNLKKAADYGSTLLESNFPAINVPPQKVAVNSNLK